MYRVQRKNMDELVSGVEAICGSSAGLGEGLASPMAGGSVAVGEDSLSLP